MLVKLLLLLLLPSVVLCLDAFNDDVLGLIVFKAGLQDPESKLVSWNEGDDSPCEWDGVKCDLITNRVTELTLDGFSLSGQISRGLLRLQSLQKISLANNSLSGSVNPEFAHLCSLHSIDLSGNNLSGSIPNELFEQCGTLKSVSFANNGFSGELPANLSSCMTLQSVNLSSNRISGKLPEKIWSLNGLESLDLSDNMLEGHIPQGIGKMYSLKVISLERNAFSGLLPEDIGSCPQLQSVNFGQNSFSGVIPESLQKLNKCTSVSLNGNLLSGEVPNWFGHMQSLESLDLSANRLFGRIPFTLGNMRSLKELNLSSNGIQGGLPHSLMNCDNLLAVDVSLNRLKGKIPHWIFELGLQKLSLSGNKFKGSIEFPPTNAPSYQSLQILDLSSNQLSGVIPSEITAFRSLQFLNMSSNLFIGSIPTNLDNLNMTRVIDLSYNALNGSIPSEIGGAFALRELRLEGNRLTGHIPPQIKNCLSLTALVLSENNLTGPIPLTIAKLTNLEIADFSHNNFSGNLPKELTDLSHLTVFNISNNNLEGELPAGGFFNTIPVTSVYGNPSLCGSVVNESCPAVHPKPIVLNPNSSTNSEDDSLPLHSHHKKLVLSVSALIAIGAAAFIFLGVVFITLLNLHVRNSSRESASPLEFSGDDEFSGSPMSDSQYGKLVMFSGEADFGTGAHALLNKDSELGRGGFGMVYHTVLGDGRLVAIKKLTISSLIKSQEEFEREVKKLGKVRHHNLVGLEGYYWTPSLQLLINEYVPGKSLFKRLHDDPSTTAATLSWHQRFNIVVGVAKGLAHLHKLSITHYNIKSSNILIDNSDEAKVGDFGLARLLPMLDRYILSSKIQSALGYMAPEFACKTVKITEKCDVYGFGILVLEIVTGRKPVEYLEDDVVVLSEMVRGALEEGKSEDCIDQRLHGNFIADEVIPVIKLGLICASQVPSNRPDMAEVVNILELIQCPSEGRGEEIVQG